MHLRKSTSHTQKLSTSSCHCHGQELPLSKTLLKEMVQSFSREERLQGSVLCKGEKVPLITYFLKSPSCLKSSWRSNPENQKWSLLPFSQTTEELGPFSSASTCHFLPDKRQKTKRDFIFPPSVFGESHQKANEADPRGDAKVVNTSLVSVLKLAQV